MEIITSVQDGAITHEDNLDNRSRTDAGDVRMISGGTGTRLSEYDQEDVTAWIF